MKQHFRRSSCVVFCLALACLGLVATSLLSGQQPKLKATLGGKHPMNVNCVAFSPDGKTVATGGWDKNVSLWDVANGKLSATLQGHADEICSIAFGPDGKTLASGSGDSTIRLWDVDAGKERAILRGHTVRGRTGGILVVNHKAVHSVSFSPDGKTLASGGDDNSVRLWDVASEKERATLRGHMYPVECVAFSPDGKILASGSKHLVTLEPKTRLLADEGEIRLSDSASGRAIAILRGHTATVSSMGFSPDGKTLASGSGDTVRLWEVATGKQKAAFPRTHKSGFVILAFSPDGKYLATGSGDKTIRLWDVAGRSVITTFKGHEGTVTSLAFSPNGKTLASGAWDWTARLWNVPVNKEPEK